MTLLATLAVLNQYDAAGAVDILDFQANGLGCTQAGSIGRCQGRPYFQARHGLEKTHNLIATQHHRKLARFAGISDPLGYLRAAKRYAVEKPQRTDRLVQRRPRNALRNKMNLKSASILNSQTIR